MEVSNMLSEGARQHYSPQESIIAQQEQNHSHQYPTRRSMSSNAMENRNSTPPSQLNGILTDKGLPMQSPQSPKPRNVAFELCFDGSTKTRGRLSLRVQIWPHDTTESIVTTVKNFFGLYDGANKGISFEDNEGNTLIASYDNFSNGMVVYVRVIPDVPLRPDFPDQWAYGSNSPQHIRCLDESMPMLPPQPVQALSYGQPPTRPESSLSQHQSASPKPVIMRTLQGQKSRSRSGLKSQGSSFQAGLDELNSDAHNDYSSSDGGAGSVTSSRKARSEQLATAEISVDNIVEGGRRKRAKFESSELPLYVPPQVPAPNSISSVSPQRRSNGADNPSPFARPTQRTFAYSIPVQSPQIYGPNDPIVGPTPAESPFQVPAMPNHGHRLRDRTSGASQSTRSSLGSTARPYGNVLPTPDPTVASCISDEDVALQLMRLGEVSNFSHGRTSASTLDDALSGRADAASSASSNSGSDSEDTEGPMTTGFRGDSGPPMKKQRRYHGEKQSGLDLSEASGDEADADHGHQQEGSINAKVRSLKSKKSRLSGASSKASKHARQSTAKKTKVIGVAQPMSPASLPPQSRKTSSASTLNFQHQLGADEDDLSSKPRCQRCRKSKKGCDRQRPCQRCKDAGIGVDGCVSEDEGNGRKGRYGRHMGVPVKKENDAVSVDQESEAASAILSGMAGIQAASDKTKKRKRQ